MFSWCELEAAFCNAAPGFRHFLDLATGRVLTIQVQMLASITTLQWITAEPGRFIHIQPITSREQHAWMLRYIGTVEDAELRAQLTSAVEGSGAFQRFKQILRGVQPERQRWVDLRRKLLRDHIEPRLTAYGMIASEGPPPVPQAGKLQEPMFGEDELRSFAREQIGSLPAHALASAVGFLRYLEGKQR